MRCGVVDGHKVATLLTQRKNEELALSIARARNSMRGISRYEDRRVHLVSSDLVLWNGIVNVRHVDRTLLQHNEKKRGNRSS